MNNAILVGTEKLAVREEKLLAQCEAVIQADIKAFIRVGHALATIKNERLYRAEYLSFEEYVAAKWDIGKAYAYRLIDANKISDTLTQLLPGTSLLASTIVDANGGEILAEDQQKVIEALLPKNEAQAFALSKFKDDPTKLLEVWTAALSTAPPGKITAKHVENTVERMTMVDKAEKIKRTREKVDHEKRFSPEFKAAFNALWEVIQAEVLTKFATTSKEAIAQHARGILDVVGY